MTDRKVILEKFWTDRESQVEGCCWIVTPLWMTAEFAAEGLGKLRKPKAVVVEDEDLAIARQSLTTSVKYIHILTQRR